MFRNMEVIAMSCKPDLEWRKREISALVDDIRRHEQTFAAAGLNVVDEFDRMEAMDILNRIERKMLSKIPTIG